MTESTRLARYPVVDREPVAASCGPVEPVCTPPLRTIFETESSYVWNSLKRLGIPDCDLDGQKMPEIADALDIPLNTAYSRLRLARAQFAATVKRCAKRRGIT